MLKNRNYKIKRNILLSAIWISVVIISFYYAYDYSISNLNYSPSQPIAFSHKTHIEKMELKCTFCHYDAVSKNSANIPSTHACMTCHLAFRNEIESLVALNNSYDNDSVLVWNKIYRLPDYTHFSHKNHINKQIDCSTCHGNVEELDSNKLIVEFTMKWCLNCHRNPEYHIIPAREISGIWKLDEKINYQSGKAITEPQFGRFNNKIKEKVHGITLPNDPGKGPLNCSACHY